MYYDMTMNLSCRRVLAAATILVLTAGIKLIGAWDSLTIGQDDDN